MEKLRKNENQNEKQKFAPMKPQAKYEDFEAIELKVAEIIEAKKVKKAKKLMELKLQLGNEVRTVVSSVAKDFNEYQLIGKKVTLVSNLASRTIKKIESNGMVLLSENEFGGSVFITPENDNIKTGAAIS